MTTASHSFRFKISRFGPAILASTLFVLAIGVLILSELRSFNLYDEGLILTGAIRVMEGDIPHRDFYANYGPGQFYLLALFFKIFGPSILVARIWGSFVKAGVVLASYLLGKRLMPRPWALVSSIFGLVWLCKADYPVWPAWPALLASLCGAIVLCDAFAKGPSRKAFLIAGGWTGVATIFRYDIGFIVAAAEAGVLLAYGVINRPYAGESVLTWQMMILGSYCAGIGVVCSPFAAAFIVCGAAGDFFYDIVIFPSHHYAATRGLQFPLPIFGRRPYSNAEYIVYFPLLMIVGAILTGALSSGRRSAHVPRWTIEFPNDLVSSRGLWQITLLTALTVGFFCKGFVRVSSLHMSLAVVPAMLILAALLSANARRKVPAAYVLFLAAAMIAAVLPSLTAYDAVDARVEGNFNHITGRDRRNALPDTPIDNSDTCNPAAGLERVACFRLAEDQEKAVQFIQANTEESDPIFVGLPQHGRIFVNNVGFYFAVARPPATKWYHFDPGLQTSNAIQQLMIADLQHSRPKYVVLDNEWENVRERNDSSIDSGVTLLDAFIQENYVRVANFGALSILQSVSDRNAALEASKSKSPAS